MPRVLVAESAEFASAAEAQLRTLGPLELEDFDYPQLLNALNGVEVLWIRLRHRIGREVMEAAPALRWIATPTTGLTHIDLAEADRRGIGVVSLRGQVSFLKNVRATAEFAITLMLSMIRNLPEATDSVRNGLWNRDLFRGAELYGKTIGLIGFGRLGRIVARYLLVFGCRVLATDVEDVMPEAGVELVSLPELLGTADIVSLHADYRPANAGFFDGACFERMKSGAYFVNTSRGELVAEDALLAALEEGRLAGAALDVVCGEPAVSGDNALVRYARRDRRLLLTPHIGGCTVESLQKAETFLAGLLVETIQSADGSAIAKKETERACVA